MFEARRPTTRDIAVAAVTRPRAGRHTQSARALLRASVAALSVSVGCVGAPKVLPPRTPPDAVPPPVALPASPPASDRARVVIFTTDGPMRVVAEAEPQFQARATEQPRSGELCVSPCVVDVPPGRYKLFLESVGDGTSGATGGDVDELHVPPGLTYYLRAPGRFEHPTWIPWSPFLVGLTGLVVTSIGLGLAAGSQHETSGLVVMGAGLGLVIGGSVYAYDAQRGSIQQGATTQWSLPLP
jgi:hypothetical protein